MKISKVNLLYGLGLALFVAAGLGIAGIVLAGAASGQSIAAVSSNRKEAEIRVIFVVNTPLPSLTPTATPTRTPWMNSPLPTPTNTPSPPPTSTPTPLPTATHTPTVPPTDTPPPTSSPTIAPTGPTPLADTQTLRVPILMYHYLSVPPRGADAIRRDLSITPALFETHLAYLREAGYETISLEELSYAFIQQASLPPKPIILTFDDGYRDNYENAFPLLKKYNYHATFFLMTQPVDTYNVNYMTWEMIQEMSQAGMEFGSHTHTHPDLRNRSREFLSTQLVHSQELIEAHLGKPVRFFCYPSGQYDSLVIETLQAADYWAAVTTQPGSEHSFGRRYEMARLRISGGYTAADLAALLE